MNSIPELVKLLERHLHEARNELTVCQYAVLSYVDDELRVTANKDEQERQELTARIAQLEAEIRNWQDCYCEFETIAPDGNLKISVLDIYNRIAELNDRIAELEAERRWIPVGERLPKEKQNVLALDRTGTAYHWEYSRSLSNIFVSDYTHWMPLPELPEEVK